MCVCVCVCVVVVVDDGGGSWLVCRFLYGKVRDFYVRRSLNKTVSESVCESILGCLNT